MLKMGFGKVDCFENIISNLDALQLNQLSPAVIPIN